MIKFIKKIFKKFFSINTTINKKYRVYRRKGKSTVSSRNMTEAEIKEFDKSMKDMSDSMDDISKSMDKMSKSMDKMFKNMGE